MLTPNLRRFYKHIEGIRYTARILPNIGVEPKVAAVAYSLNKGETSKPIIGNDAVYVISVTAKTEPTITPLEIERSRNMTQQTYYSIVFNQLYPSLLDNIKVDDKRWKFY